MVFGRVRLRGVRRLEAIRGVGKLQLVQSALRRTPHASVGNRLKARFRSFKPCVHTYTIDMSNNYPRNQIPYNLPPNLQTFYKMFHTTLI
ncbi:hypothetical protein QVD17_41682 [Tagetes erecta]|uniref:Uncharacterized protein n=1 Tax=Tagetes erecta TaxID=13708 RepID=A0AAD8JKX2_TARER|nr:hypothetical protein QVD17_41682 [Tagetes erecta]